MALTLSPNEFFRRADTLPFADVSAIVGNSGLVVVAPHPDDESLGCGGLIALCKAKRQPAHVVFVSDGAASHPNSRRYPHDALRDLRESEARAACGALGLGDTDITFLRLSDSRIPAEGPDADDAVACLIACVKAVDASAVAVTWRHDPHCDHQACFALVRAAVAGVPDVRLIEYPVWGHTLPDNVLLDEEPRGVRLDITSAILRKRVAILAHRSQVTRMIDDDPDGFILSSEMLERFDRPFEIFLEMP